MKKQITQVSLVQNGKLMAAIYLALSVPFLLIMLAVGAFSGAQLISLPIILVAIVLYAAGGFVGTVLGGWIYNLVAARVGGFEFTTVEVNGG